MKATKQTREEAKTSRVLRSVLYLLLVCMMLPTVTLAEERDIHRPVNSYAPRKVERISWFRRHFKQVPWEEAVRSCEKPSDVCSIVGNQLSYDSESGDKWTGAHATWEKRTGDCEDFAICVVEMCRELGIDAWVELYFPAGPTPGHAVAVGRYKGTLWVSSIGGYEEVRSTDEISELVAAMLWCNEKGMWKAVMDYDAIQRRMQQTSNS